MRSLYLIITVLISSLVYAQPQAFKYQSVVRDASGELLVNKNVAFQISIIEGDINNTAIYTEEHQAVTSSYGSVTLEIGRGENPTSDFTDIDWATGSHFVQVAWDLSGGTNYEVAGTSELLSVPYALYSNTSTKLILNDENNIPNEVIVRNGSLGLRKLAKPDFSPAISNITLEPVLVGSDGAFGDIYDYNLELDIDLLLFTSFKFYTSIDNSINFLQNSSFEFTSTKAGFQSILNQLKITNIAYLNIKVSYVNEFGEGPVSDVFTVVFDKDGDGYNLGYDCNDELPSTNPSSVEICGDGFDNNCNGEIDETCIDDDMFEPNENKNIAASIDNGSYSDLVITYQNEDWYSFSSSDGDNIIVEAIFSHASGDINILLVDDLGQVVAESNSTTDNESLNYVSNGAGYLYLLVYGGANNFRNTYTLKVNP